MNNRKIWRVGQRWRKYPSKTKEADPKWARFVCEGHCSPLAGSGGGVCDLKCNHLMSAFVLKSLHMFHTEPFKSSGLALTPCRLPGVRSEQLRCIAVSPWSSRLHSALTRRAEKGWREPQLSISATADESDPLRSLPLTTFWVGTRAGLAYHHRLLATPVSAELIQGPLVARCVQKSHLSHFHSIIHLQPTLIASQT